MERGRIIVNNTDYTGSFVTPNPSEPPTKDLNTLEIEGEVFNIAGSGGGGVGDITNYYGVFIDTNNIIQSFVHITDTAEHTYIATEDCAVVYYIPNDTNTDVYIKLDGIQVGGQYGQYINATSDIVYMKKGQVFSYQTTYTVSSGAGYTVYGLQSGDRIPALIQDAQIYSLEEKQVGVWTDGKPLYQKTIQVTLSTIGSNIYGYYAEIDTRLYLNNPENVFFIRGQFQVDGTQRDWIEGAFEPPYMYVYTGASRSNVPSTITFQYTKTTDEEGNGGYQAYGMSPVIYSTKEREIGVWIDNKPLYQKTFEKSISVTSTSRTWYTVITSSELRAIDADKIFIETSDSYIEDSDGLYEVNYSSIVGNLGGLMGGVYDKTTDVVQLCIAGVSAGTKTAKITIKYTKTTDSPKRTGYELLDIQENQIIVDATRYSTEEKIIGTWIDNKPLYQKTYVISSIPSNSYDYYNFASNVDKVINYQGMVIDTSSDASMNIYYVRPDNTNVQFYTQLLADKRFFFRTYTSWTASAYITFYYTKTTDAAGSGGYQAYGFSPIIYSEEEREVGVWTDNKPLYQKTIHIPNVTKSSWSSYSFGIENAIVHDLKGYVLTNNGVKWAINYYQSNTFFSVYFSNSSVTIYWNYGNANSAEADVTILYTKTTDVAGSGEYNTLGIPNVHYMTDEQVIGTWIDGKPLYQKTYNINETIYNQEDKTIDVSSLNIKKYINGYGTFMRNVNWASPIIYIETPFNLYESNFNHSYLRYGKSSNTIDYGVTLGDNETATDITFTIQYTKTTD